MTQIYFDHNATTDVLPQVKKAIVAVLDKPYNASSIHSIGRQAKFLLTTARRTILQSLNACEKEYELIFTSSGTESNNLLINGLEDFTFFIPPTEHASILETVKSKVNIQFIPIDKNGLIKLDELELLLANSPSSKKIVSVMLANNETGLIQDIEKIAILAHKHGALMHTDAVQAYGKVDINVDNLNIDFITISSHKIGGTLGAAALIKKKNLELKAMIKGGKQENKLRAGTENIIAITGFSEAAKMIKSLISSYQSVMHLRDSLEEKILNISPDAKIYSKQCERLPNTSCIAMPNVISETQLITFDLSGVAISAGSACSSGKIDKSHVLSAMDNNDPLASNAIRVSLGLSNTMEEIDKFVKLWSETYFNSKASKLEKRAI